MVDKIKVYVLELGFKRFYFEDQEEAINAWKSLNSSSIQELENKKSWSDSSSPNFWYSNGRPKVKLFTYKTKIFKNVEEAEKARKNWRDLNEKKMTSKNSSEEEKEEIKD